MSFNFAALFQILSEQLQNYSTVFVKCSFCVCFILLNGITYKDLENREAKAHRAIMSDYGGMYFDELCLQYCT
jgi:hypothetical protein